MKLRLATKWDADKARREAHGGSDGGVVPEAGLMCSLESHATCTCTR